VRVKRQRTVDWIPTSSARAAGRSRRVNVSAPQRRAAVAAIVAALCLSLAGPSPARAGDRPLRSGRIISGVLTTSPSWSCRMVPDCAAWLASGCDPTLAGRDPAWLASIVPIGTLADGATARQLAYGPAESVGGVPLGVVPGGVTVEFWLGDCSPIGRWTRIWPPSGGLRWGAGSVVVPRGAAWMTVTANDKVNLAWRLT